MLRNIKELSVRCIEFWRISLLMEYIYTTRDIFFYRRMLETPWSENVINDFFQIKIETKIFVLIGIKLRQLKSSGYIIRKVDVENLLHTGNIEGKWHWVKQCVDYITHFCKWMVEQSLFEVMRKQNILKVRHYRMLSRAVIVYFQIRQGK